MRDPRGSGLRRRAPWAGALMWILLLAAACAPAAPPASGSAGAPAGPASRGSAAAPDSASAPATARPPADSAATQPPAVPPGGAPVLPTAPVSLRMGGQATNSYAGVFIALERGYFREVGLDVDVELFGTGVEMRPGIVAGQLPVGGGGLNAGSLNLVAREADVKVVADMESVPAGREGFAALTVRKDLWDRGVIRSPYDIVGREVYGPGGTGSAQYLQLLHWADQHGVDKSRISMTNMGTTDVRTGLANGAIELGFVSEPNLSAGLEAGDFVVLASSGDLYPGQQMLVMLFNTRAIEEAGELVGERFMVAYLRGVRDYLNAFYYDQGTDAVIDALVKHTLVKDRALFRKMRPNWADPNGRVNVSNLVADAQLLTAAGLMREVPNLSNVYAAKYADYAVRYLGEYQPPR
ncbi:MAG TPA: ABC transporter substrate-binding protein [Chloroflexota bacterium]|nr:ABC transporter substrate-binding protein [Chloroflexota bacterium]